MTNCYDDEPETQDPDALYDAYVDGLLDRAS